MAVAAIVGAGDVRELAHLPRRERAVGNSDPQHIGVELKVDAVHQPQRLELVFAQRPIKPPLDLVAELADALGDET